MHTPPPPQTKPSAQPSIGREELEQSGSKEPQEQSHSSPSP